jgi:hypothetical protein
MKRRFRLQSQRQKPKWQTKTLEKFLIIGLQEVKNHLFALDFAVV